MPKVPHHSDHQQRFEPINGRQEPIEMTVIIKDRAGNQERIDIPQPSAQLMQAMRDSVRR